MCLHPPSTKGHTQISYWGRSILSLKSHHWERDVLLMLHTRSLDLFEQDNILSIIAVPSQYDQSTCSDSSTFSPSTPQNAYQSSQSIAHRKLSISFSFLAALPTASAAARFAGLKCLISAFPASPGGLRGSSSKYKSAQMKLGICPSTPNMVNSPSSFPRRALFITRRISPFRK